MTFIQSCVLSLLFVTGILCDVTVKPEARVSCTPDPDGDEAVCKSRGCIWDADNIKNAPTVPACYFPQDSGYILSEHLDDNTAVLIPSTKSPQNPFGQNFPELQFSKTQLGSVLKISITPTAVKRYVPPVPLHLNDINATSNFTVSTSNPNETFSFQVVREGTNTSIWDTSISGLQFADQYIQIATYLPTDKIYGFGENVHKRLKHNFTKYTTWGMMARDQPPQSSDGEGENLYGVHPFYLGLEADGNAHGVFIFNSNPQDVTTGPAPHLVYRTIGGQLDIFFFPGPTPADVITQYHQIIGKPFLPAYWNFGFQLCRYGYTGTEEVKETVARIKAAGIPQDVQFADINYMDEYKDFTYNENGSWKGWPEFTDYLHSQGQKVVLIFDPTVQVEYDTFLRGIEQNVSWISWPREDMVQRNITDLYPSAENTTIMLSVVWPNKHVGFPDFLDPTNITINWWADEFKRYHEIQQFDGIWIDMNEPAVFGTNQEKPYAFDHAGHPNLTNLMCPMEGADSVYDVPPYKTQSVYFRGNESFMAESSLCLCGRSVRGSTNLYNTRNLFGWSESIASWKGLEVMRGKRSVVLSRSTFPSSGQYAGHWLGDNSATWEDLRDSIITVQEFNMFGIPYVGADICGFFGNTTEELCLRWQQLGAYHSFMRNHNLHVTILQDPAQWPTVANATRQANLNRYRHLPYLFSLHVHVSRFGGMVVRPVFFEFPSDPVTHQISFEFMWGPAVLVAPVIEPNVTKVNAYLPIDAEWYALSDINYGQAIPSGNGTFDAPWTSLIPAFLRAGYILPRQGPALTTVAARVNPFELVIASKNNNSTQSGVATGELYWDDGDTWIPVGEIEKHDFAHFIFDFGYNASVASLNIFVGKKMENQSLPTLDTIEIFGYQPVPNDKNVIVNGKQVEANVTYLDSSRILRISRPGLIDLNGDSVHLTWDNKHSGASGLGGLFERAIVIVFMVALPFFNV